MKKQDLTDAFVVLLVAAAVYGFIIYLFGA
jgi:hypothetical protein